MLKKVEKEQLKVPAHIDYLGELRDFVTKIGERHGFSPKVINAFKLAVDEASTNIIRHAYRDEEGHITIRALVKKNSLTISLIDQGTFFDPQRVKDPDLNRYIDIGKKGGLGIFIMRKLMDEIDYRKTEEGNELRITKYREVPEKTQKLSKAVSGVPSSIKAKFFFKTIAFITIVAAGSYTYFYSKADDEIVSEFVTSRSILNAQIVNRLNSALTEGAYIPDVGKTIYSDHEDQIHRLSIEDSTGLIEYSSKLEEELTKFSRPSDATSIADGVFKYSTDDMIVYEFERVITIKGTNKRYGKAHIYVSSSSTEAAITADRMKNLKLAMTVWGAAVVGVAVLIYLVMSPLQKLSEWIKDLGHGEIDDEIDIDASGEIGEIAAAFTDITSKFRESQRHLADQERLQKEMQVAQDIQQTLLPMEFPELEGYEIASYYEAAKEVGGDYYDFVEVDKDTLGIAVADVSGKGVPGSLVMTMIRTALRTEARGLKDAAEVLARVNEFVSNDIKKGMFVTIFYLIVDSKRRRINYASAGHNPMILYRGSTKKTYYLNPKGFPIGIQLPQKDLFRRSIQSETIELTKDDVLLVYTDGITEAMNPARELFGEERLLQMVRKHGHLEVNEFAENLKNGIYSFTEGNQQYDDISMVAVKEKSTREEDELRRAKEAHRLIMGGLSIREAFNSVNLTTYAYYNKYKKIFEQGGLESVEVDEDVSVEAKHLSIEEKTKILDIIANCPEYGPGRISEELNTEKYGFTEIPENKIYDELVRSRLNTRQLREAYINKSKRSNRRPKPPGTPMMTLDGQIVVDRKAHPDTSKKEEPKSTPAEEPAATETEEDSKQAASAAPESTETPTSATDEDQEGVVEQPTKRKSSDVEADSLIDLPLDQVLSDDNGAEEEQEEQEESETLNEGLTSFDKAEDTPKVDLENDSFFEETSEVTSDDETDRNGTPPQSDASVESSLLEDISFEQFFTDDNALSEESFEDDEIENPSLGHEDQSEQQSETDVKVKKPASASSASGGQAKKESDQPKTDEAPEKEKSDGVSFADLLQAIDEEIVYVKDKKVKSPTKGSSTQKNGQEKASGARKTDKALASESSLNENAGKTVDGKKSPKLTDREKILVKGIKYYKKKDYENAIREFTKVIETYPKYKEAHNILGNAYFRNQMYDKAADAYETVKQLDPNDVSAYENMGVIYANRGEMKRAVGEWKRVLELSPDREDIANKIKKALRML